MTFLSGSALADQKIATVDLKKLFDNYWKTRRQTPSRSAPPARHGDKGMKADLKKGSDDYQKLLLKVNDQASPPMNATAQQATDEKLKQLQSQKSASNSLNARPATLGEQRQRMRENILIEIKVAVNAKPRLRIIPGAGFRAKPQRTLLWFTTTARRPDEPSGQMMPAHD